MKFRIYIKKYKIWYLKYILKKYKIWNLKYILKNITYEI